MNLHGVLVVDKTAGMTSAHVVARVKRVLNVKVGHTGTLDPMATGVLPLCLGQGTKLAAYLLAADKQYEAELELGATTDTLDAEGRVTARDPDAAAAVDEARLRAALDAFRGDISQVPPMYSAIKHKGKRLHELARAGTEVEREPRPVRIDRLELTGFTPPRARFSVACSKGTYVRVLAADLGAALGCGAHLTALRRTRSGRFDLSAAVPADEITPALASARLISCADALDHLPGQTIPPEKLGAIANGQRLPWAAVAGKRPAPSGTCRLLTPSLELLALVRVEEGRLRFERVFSYVLT